ncbi:uncharacterized protein LOC115098864 isoform X2 [Rhinatrema bivittatum]|uniref:uncharacterized protein LOC115098864 isoform X2 n=1 Tax=Rhinatrema bivittatum TaxID=194408 RepID=UPI001125DFD6|nr:uncharacterized protein LOC115098864 isoform X2 [Rhinatrema bivittatum]XP_029471770.1 uncharacterized protein LOC115098864 isoform X2 [Rhinatrema bivittatum]
MRGFESTTCNKHWPCGRSPKALTIDLLEQQGFDESNLPPLHHAHNVTVPGTAALWCDALSLYGSAKFSIGEILQPAISLAEQGFPVSEITAYHWKKEASVLQIPSNPHGKDLLIHGEAPGHGHIFRNPFLAETFKELSRSGKRGFYEGRIAKAVVETVQKNGGTLALEDLRNHATEEVEPIYATYKGVKVWEMPPNGQGITALMALNIIENFNLRGLDHNSADYLHVLVEAVKLSFSDTLWFCADPSCVPVPTQEILSKAHCRKRSELIDTQRASVRYAPGDPCQTGNDTVYYTVMDAEGNACSFINSIYFSFGTGLVPEGCGFSLHNRGANFSLSPGHPNCLASGKRPFHTIIPAMATAADSEDLLCTFGVMGGFMQPQGHVQVLLNMMEFGMNPQQALDAARFCVEYVKKEDAWQLFLEDGISKETAEDLKARGHNVQWPTTGFERCKFGRGQIITNGTWWESWDSSKTNKSCHVLWAGSDPRGDGCAMGY